MRACVIRTNARRLPSAVVSRRIALVQLKLARIVIAGVDEGDTKGSEPSVLGIALFEVAEASDELFARDFFIVREEVALGSLTGVVDEDVGVGSHAGDGADHVATRILVFSTSSNIHISILRTDQNLLLFK